MKSLMSLWSRLAEESASLCSTSARQDINTVLVRSEHEGSSFFTITLPDYGKSIQKWIDCGQVSINSSFARGRGRGFPRFLGGFLARVFDRDSGLLLDEPCVASIQALRELTLAFGKMEYPCSQARNSKAILRFIECEQDVRMFDKRLTKRDLDEFTSMSNMLFGQVFSEVDRDIYYHRLIPKHGPGSTADGLMGNQKFNQAVWTERLDAVFPAGEYLLPNWSYYRQLDGVDILEPGREVPVKVTLVPKTLKSPRVIAMEPTCMQYMQQAILRSFLEHFEKDDFLPNVIGFDDQTPNQELARQGSLDQRTATLDLSDASDRVSNQLVRAMLSRHPHLFAAVDASRSRRATLPDGTVMRLSKFASMGSALCFPFEAMVFTTLIFMGIQRSLNTSLTPSLLKEYEGLVRVFGDDLIVPTDHVLPVIESLEHFGAKVGSDKSFWTGRFRESCGREYFNGHDVCVTRVRQAFPTSRKSVTEVISLVSLRNRLFMSGYWQTCKWLDGILSDVLTHFPTVLPTSSVLGRVSFLGFESQRAHPSLHTPLVRGYVVRAKPPSDMLEGPGALLKCLTKLDADAWLRGKVPWHPSDTVLPVMGGTLVEFAPQVHVNHLERSGRPKSLSIKLGWRSPL